MARVTVEDCVLRIPNRFELVMLASQRAREISSGAQETVTRDNDKNPVIALREIADETIDLAEVQETLVSGLQKHRPEEDHEDDLDETDTLAIQSAIAAETGMTIGGDSTITSRPGASEDDDALASALAKANEATTAAGSAPAAEAPAENAAEAEASAADETS